MVVERAELPIKEGQMEEFARMMRDEGLPILAAADGCHAAEGGVGVESPDKFLLLLRWDSVEHHTEFTKTDEFARFRELIGPHFAGPPSMEHYTIV